MKNKILIIEQEGHIRRLIKDYLINNWNYIVTATPDVPIGISKLSREIFDILIIDSELGLLSGIAGIIEEKELITKIIFINRGENLEEAIYGINYGVSAWLEKENLNLNDVTKIIESLLVDSDDTKVVPEGTPMLKLEKHMPHYFGDVGRQIHFNDMDFTPTVLQNLEDFYNVWSNLALYCDPYAAPHTDFTYVYIYWNYFNNDDLLKVKSELENYIKNKNWSRYAYHNNEQIQHEDDWQVVLPTVQLYYLINCLLISPNRNKLILKDYFEDDVPIDVAEYEIKRAYQKGINSK